MPVVIAPERPDTADAVSLIAELETHLASFYPAESRHGYSVEKLIKQGVAFFVVRVDGSAAGCGGIQLCGEDYGELKRMYVRPEFRGMGLAHQLVEFLLNYAKEHGQKLVRLETGIHQQAAISLYEKEGFRPIPPFGPYFPDPLSQCYERAVG